MKQQTGNPFTEELAIEPVPSRLILIFILLIHGCAAIVLLVVPGLEVWWRLALFLFVLSSLIYCWCQHQGWWAKKAVKKLYWREFGGWELINGEDQHLPVILQGNSFSHIWLTVLNFKTRRALGSQHYTVVLLTDNCDFVIRRRLRMRIKLL